MSDYESGDDLFEGICTPPPSSVITTKPAVKRKQPEDEYGDFDEDLEEIVEIAASATKRVKFSSEPGGDDKAANALARGILAESFGYDSFRHEQEGAIDAILRGENALAIFPTGAGKSLCYQVCLL
jgi:superfamily II DNA helicase RecQ